MMLLKYLTALKKEILVFVVSLIASASIIVASTDYWNETLIQNKKSEKRLVSAQKKHREAIKRMALIEEYKSRYERIEKKSIVGKENRIDWIDQLEKIANNDKIPYINYKIDRRVDIKDSKLKKKYPGLKMYKSVMTLEMKLLHEGDLYTVMNSLKHNAKGMFDISSCTIKRIKVTSQSIVVQASKINFSAKCTLNWYSFEAKSA